MNTRIAENIRIFRKEQKMTQERLAEALGVTVGAVSKWESGSSVPDITLIMDIAEFFGTSIDVLLGYNLQSDGASKAVARIKKLRNEKNFDASSSEAEKALQKYPNSFEIAFASAVQYSMKGVEKHCENSHRRALSLYERSLELISQNKDETINEWTIKNRIAESNLCLGQTDKALEQMKSNNADGLNDGYIGFTLSTINKPEEAMEYLSSAFLSTISKLLYVVNGYNNVYRQQNDYHSSLSIMHWLYSIITGLKQDGKASYINKLESQALSTCACAADLSGDVEQAKELLKKAIEAAKVFDSAPEYSFSNMKFFHSEKGLTAFDDFGKTAMEGINNILAEDEKVRNDLMTTFEEAII